MARVDVGVEREVDVDMEVVQDTSGQACQRGHIIGRTFGMMTEGQGETLWINSMGGAIFWVG